MFLPVWLIAAYALLPRVHQILGSLYVPDYSTGRTRTGDGVLGYPVNLAVIGPERDLREAMTTCQSSTSSHRVHPGDHGSAGTASAPRPQSPLWPAVCNGRTVIVRFFSRLVDIFRSVAEGGTDAAANGSGGSGMRKP